MNSSKSNSMSHLVHRWERLLSAVATHADDLQSVEDVRAQLETELADFCATRIRRRALQAEVLRMTQDLGSLRERVADLASRLRAGLHVRYGFHSEILSEFGIKPVRPESKRRKPNAAHPGAPLETHRTVK